MICILDKIEFAPALKQNLSSLFVKITKKLEKKASSKKLSRLSY